MPGRCDQCGRLVELPCRACAVDQCGPAWCSPGFSVPVTECDHDGYVRKHGRDSAGRQRYRCSQCGASVSRALAGNVRFLGGMRIDPYEPTLIVSGVLAGQSARSIAASIGLKPDTVCRVVALVGAACRDRCPVLAPVNDPMFRVAVSRVKSDAYVAAVAAIFSAWSYVKAGGGSIDEVVRGRFRQPNG